MNRALGPRCTRTHLSVGPCRETTLHASKHYQLTRLLCIYLLVQVKSAEITDGIHFQLTLKLQKLHTRQKPVCIVWCFLHYLQCSGLIDGLLIVAADLVADPGANRQVTGGKCNSPE